MLPAGAKISVVDADKYTALKNSIHDKVFAIYAPDLNDKEKWAVIAVLENELDDFIRNNHKRDIE
ncbi:MAG: hypothetical protein P4L41_10305 [Flavipsychrobacter sp.]|nr:hypothetical protein [Flavipsychrobacter sp.]